MNIYTITGLNDLEDLRCFGWLPTVEEALIRVANNTGDLHEDRYTHLVIERIESGVFPVTKALCWFVWEGKWVACDRPAGWERVVNFALA